jgi:nicotinamide mononucleotide transporter
MLCHLAFWLKTNYIELAGTITGFIYIYFQIKENIWLWPFGIITSSFFIYVFFQTKFYADMGLNVYYLFISIYGWAYWEKGKKNPEQEKLPISTVGPALWIILAVISFLLFGIIAYVLKEFTDSPIPYLDSFTTSLSIVATWMLARKLLQHWLLWIVIDATSFVLYIYKGLYATTLLFIVYTVLAILGYMAWKKEFNLQHEEN